MESRLASIALLLYMGWGEADHWNDPVRGFFILHEIAAGSFEFFIEPDAFIASDDSRFDVERFRTDFNCCLRTIL